MSFTLKIRAQQDACANVAEHNYGPDGYLAWHAWAKRLGKTHTWHRCPGCGYYLIVRPKAKIGVPS